MKIALTYSTKEGLRKEYRKRFAVDPDDEDIPPDLFAEGDDPQTIEAIVDALQLNNHQVVSFEGDGEIAANLEQSRPDIVFNVTEGLFGDWRESYVPLICERLGLPYTGSDPLTLAICLNKARCKEILSYYHIPNATFQVIYPGDDGFAENFKFPAIIKPLAEGSSKGIFDNSVVYSKEQADDVIASCFAKYNNEPVIMEKYLAGPEFTVAILGNSPEMEVLPIIGMDFSQLPTGAQPIYSYEAKWIWDRPEKPLNIFTCPAQIDDNLKNQIELLVRRTCRILNIRDWCRLDVRLDENGVAHILEINPLPGILPNPEDNSCFPKAARTAGYTYPAMLNQVVQVAARRYGLS
ncbi:MAG TPA: D-alanine--D-alanine ligase [Candidatus Marinimicrobia bacterium]|nr:D-alanine--D-alanine ligase [Candidatus Neomarinimicrobiota bacterium]